MPSRSRVARNSWKARLAARDRSSGMVVRSAVNTPGDLASTSTLFEVSRATRVALLLACSGARLISALA
jgi:hypothetical protein